MYQGKLLIFDLIDPKNFFSFFSVLLLCSLSCCFVCWRSLKGSIVLGENYIELKEDGIREAHWFTVVTLTRHSVLLYTSAPGVVIVWNLEKSTEKKKNYTSNFSKWYTLTLILRWSSSSIVVELRICFANTVLKPVPCKQMCQGQEKRKTGEIDDDRNDGRGQKEGRK